MAVTNIQKTVATLLRRYHANAVDPNEPLVTESVGISEKAGPLWCTLQFRKD
jgi:hypothetical protein